MITEEQTGTVISPKTHQGFVKAISGIFDLTPKEIKIIAIILYLLEQEHNTRITKDIKANLVSITGHSQQVITNYLNKFRKKKVIDTNNQLHKIFTNGPVTIEYNDKKQDKSNM